MPGPVSVTLTAKWPLTDLAVTRTSPVSVNLIALPTRLSSTWVRRCSSPRPIGSDFSTEVVSVSFLLGERLGGRAYRLDHALDGVFCHVQGELAGLDLGDVQYGIDEAQEVLAVGADAGEGIKRFRSLRLVEALLDEFGIPENGRKGGSELVAHVGHELVLVLACNLKIFDRLGKLAR